MYRLGILDFIIRDKGIEIDPKRIESIKIVQLPKCTKDLQKFLRKSELLEEVYWTLIKEDYSFHPHTSFKR
jgi:hypothetical protein